MLEYNAGKISRERNELVSSLVSPHNCENERRVSARDYARQNHWVTTLGTTCARGIYFENTRGRERERERERFGGGNEKGVAGARCGALMTGNRQYELDGSVPHRVPQ